MFARAGIKQEGVVFLFTDSQVTNERFLVYLNDLLASGNIQDLYSKDEKDSVSSMVEGKAKAAGLITDVDVCWEYFLSQIRVNLHVVICFSPVGPEFSTYAKRFPALISGTTIDWFQPWSAEALASVAQKQLSDIEFTSPAMRAAIEKFMPLSFDMASQAAARYLADEGRHVYLTPKSYLEMLGLYRTVLIRRRRENTTATVRLENGISRLRDAASSVGTLEKELTTMVQAADEKRELSESIAARVASEKMTVELETDKANEEAAKVAAIQAEVQRQNEDAERDLLAAEPAIKAATAALDTLDRRDLGSCKTMATPPKGVGDVFSAVCVLLAGVNQGIIVQRNGKVKDKDRSWEACKKSLLGNVNGLVDELKNFKALIDKDCIPKVNFQEVRPYLALEHFNEDAMKKKNSAAAGLVGWVKSIVDYYDIWLDVEPKRLKVVESTLQLEAANSELALVRERVDELQGRLGRLTAEYEKADKDKREAVNTAERGQLKLELAQRLINALGSEEVRWVEGVGRLQHEREPLVGDALVAAAFISYCGPFNKAFRDHLLYASYIPYLQVAVAGNPIPMRELGEGVSIVSIIASEAEVAGWNAEGLPRDLVSIENGAIVTSSKRWPLIIDPQLQGVAWIKSRQSSRVHVQRLGQPKLLAGLRTAIAGGTSILIENMGERVDAILLPILRRAILKKGGRALIAIGDDEIDYSSDFELFLHTKLSNPHYPPELQAELTLVNFTVTPPGLEDQLLSLVIRKERPDLAARKAAVIHQGNEFKIRIKQLEDDILVKLSTAEGDITEDRTLIEGLESAKQQSLDATARLEEGRDITKSINLTAERYREVAKRGATVFFLMNSLHRIHTYYIYSLNAFVVLFQHGIDLVHDAERKAKVARKPKTMLSKLKAATSKIIQMQRFNWNEDLLHQSSLAGEQDISTLSTQLLQKKSIEEKGDLSDLEFQKRCTHLATSITTVLFKYMERGFFARDRLTVVVLLSFAISQASDNINIAQLSRLLSPLEAVEPAGMADDVASWLPGRAWARLKGLEDGAVDTLGVMELSDLGDQLTSGSEEWRAWYKHPEPETQHLPGSSKELSGLPFLLVLRAMRTDRIPAALQNYVGKHLGTSFSNPQSFSMLDVYMESSASTPVFFVLFPGVDPTPWVESLGLGFDISVQKSTLKNISMGQGQEAPAEACLDRMAKQGGWIMLQNIQLMESWLPKLERKLELASEAAAMNFRCFLSAEPPPLSHMYNIPESLLQTCIKVANEAPADLRSNLQRAWSCFSQEHLDACNHTSEYRRCLFGLCFFHAIILGRRRFGQQGWSRQYGFNTGDLKICADVLMSYMNKAQESADGQGISVPWDDLRYIFGEIMYGGHITDFWDRRTNVTYLKALFNEQLLRPGGQLAPGLSLPDTILDYPGYSAHIDGALPAESPVLFGLHPNAEVGYLTSTAEQILGLVVRLRRGASAGSSAPGHATDNGVHGIVDSLEKRLPKRPKLSSVQEKARPLLAGPSAPYVVVAMQEVVQMNFLGEEIARSLGELRKGLNGQLNMSQQMEDLSSGLALNEVPGRNPFHSISWEKLAWPSRKKLDDWFDDLEERAKQLISWEVKLELPISLWLALFNPTAFLTAIQQVSARTRNLPLDNMTIETNATIHHRPEELEVLADKRPPDGAFIHGLHMQGARWMEIEEASTEGTKAVKKICGVSCGGVVTESQAKELLARMPVLYVKAVLVDANWEPTSIGHLRPDAYNCPCYYTSFRGPTYVFLATLDTQEPAFKWVLAGVALLLSTD